MPRGWENKYGMIWYVAKIEEINLEGEIPWHPILGIKDYGRLTVVMTGSLPHCKYGGRTYEPLNSSSCYHVSLILFVGSCLATKVLSANYQL